MHEDIIYGLTSPMNHEDTTGASQFADKYIVSQKAVGMKGLEPLCDTAYKAVATTNLATSP